MLCVIKYAYRANKDFSTDSAKVYHRTLDLLECWIEDSRSVDFTSNSCLQPTLNKFLTSEVINGFMSAGQSFV